MEEIKLLTKNDIMKMWNDSSDESNNYPCCPNCRDNLIETVKGDGLFCNNVFCLNNNVYTKKGNKYFFLRQLNDDEKMIHGKSS